MLSTKLIESGYTVTTAENGNKALKLLDENVFDIVLLDIVMPGLDGIEVLKKIREKYPVSEFPVIMVTAENETQGIVNALNSGANDYITKPVDLRVVLARLKTQLTLKRSEEVLKKYSEDLEQSNKLKDLFIDIMGHDLLKPADIARLTTELILDNEEDNNKRELLKNILQSSNKIIDLIENASILAKLESGEKLEFSEEDIGKVLREVAEELNDVAAEKKMEIKLYVNGEYRAMVNPLIYDVFSNLLGNSLKYSPEKSRVIAKISNGHSKCKITFADNGTGVPDEYKEGIFDRFKRLEKGGVKGSGLGLAIVKRVIDAHHGRVWVEDNPEGGSVFNVEIPISSGS
jgi:signal transduction histidine kinase